MKALLSDHPGGPAALRYMDVDDPAPAAHEVRIAVKACGINYPDALIIEDRYQFKPARPFSPGSEVSGYIDALGEGVDNFRIGDRVIGGGVFGGLATKFVAKASSCYHVPDNMPHDVAAALMMTYGTSHYALKVRGQVQPGERMLVVGAAGGVGLAAVEIGKKLGAHVVAAVSSPEKAGIATQYGADAAVVYPRDGLSGDSARQFSEYVKAAAGGQIDVVYDAVGGSYAEPSLRTLGWGGRYLVIGFPAGVPSIPLNLPLLKGCDIRGVFWGASVARDPAANRQNIDELLRWHEEGALRPHIAARFPLEEGGRAIDLLSSRQVAGKVIVTMESAGDAASN